MPEPNQLELPGLETEVSPDPQVEKPAHYTSGDVEVIAAIEAWKLDYHLGNVVKYVARAGKKDPAAEVQDLEKARWYLARAIRLRKAGRNE